MEIQQARAMAQLFSVYAKNGKEPSVPRGLFDHLADDEEKLLRGVLLWLLLHPEDRLLTLSVRYADRQEFVIDDYRVRTMKNVQYFDPEKHDHYVSNRYQISDDPFFLALEDWGEFPPTSNRLCFIFKSDSPLGMIILLDGETNGISNIESDPSIYVPGVSGADICVQAMA